jgi:hypothetical protein
MRKETGLELAMQSVMRLTQTHHESLHLNEIHYAPPKFVFWDVQDVRIDLRTAGASAVLRPQHPHDAQLPAMAIVLPAVLPAVRAVDILPAVSTDHDMCLALPSALAF